MGNGEDGPRLGGAAANDNGGPEARIEAAVMRIARLLGRQIAHEEFARIGAANDNAPASEAGDG